MNALLRTSPSWDYIGQRRTVEDDRIERRAECLSQERIADPARMSAAIRQLIEVEDPYTYPDSQGNVHSVPGVKRGLPLMRLFLAGDDVEFCARLRSEAEKQIRTSAYDDARDEVSP